MTFGEKELIGFIYQLLITDVPFLQQALGWYWYQFVDLLVLWVHTTTDYTNTQDNDASGRLRSHLAISTLH